MPWSDAPAARRLETEWLDVLSPSAPQAKRSRRDLRRVNGWMRHGATMAKLLRRMRQEQPPPRLVDLGAGDGRFMLAVARRLGPGWAGAEVELLDRQDIVPREVIDGFAALGWRARRRVGDIEERLRGLRAGETDIVCANLVLHHFQDTALSTLLAHVAHAGAATVALEPRRSATAALGCRLLPLIGCNEVTRHDALASVRAGFAGDDLSRLWRQVTEGARAWRLQEGPAGLFSHAFSAQPATGSGP